MTHCTLGVGCEEVGACYSDAHGQPLKCGALPTKLYRYDNEVDVVVLREYDIIKHTKCGYWIPRNKWTYPFDGKKRFVLSTGLKRFAYETEALARQSFFKRKERQIAILSQRLKNIEASVKALKENRIADYNASNYFDF